MTAEPELLEPLPVDLDGEMVAPVPAARAMLVRDVLPTAQEVIDAVCATIAESQAVRALPPWSQAAPVVAPAATGARGSFLRMIVLNPARLTALPSWWDERVRDGAVTVTRRLALGAPRPRACGTWCMSGQLRSPGRARPLAVELALWPHLGHWTKLSVEPRHGVRAGRRYFASGHRALDVLTDRLIREL